MIKTLRKRFIRILSLIHISEPTRRTMPMAPFCAPTLVK